MNSLDVKVKIWSRARSKARTQAPTATSLVQSIYVRQTHSAQRRQSGALSTYWEKANETSAHTAHTYQTPAHHLTTGYWVLAAHRIYICLLQFAIDWTLVASVDFNFIQLISHCTFNWRANASRTYRIPIYCGDLCICATAKNHLGRMAGEIAAHEMFCFVNIPSHARCCHSGIIESAHW